MLTSQVGAVISPAISSLCSGRHRCAWPFVHTRATVVFFRSPGSTIRGSVQVALLDRECTPGAGAPGGSSAPARCAGETPRWRKPYRVAAQSSASSDISTTSGRPCCRPRCAALSACAFTATSPSWRSSATPWQGREPFYARRSRSRANWPHSRSRSPPGCVASPRWSRVGVLPLWG